MLTGTAGRAFWAMRWPCGFGTDKLWWRGLSIVRQAPLRSPCQSIKVRAVVSDQHEPANPARHSCTQAGKSPANASKKCFQAEFPSLPALRIHIFFCIWDWNPFNNMKPKPNDISFLLHSNLIKLALCTHTFRSLLYRSPSSCLRPNPPTRAPMPKTREFPLRLPAARLPRPEIPEWWETTE